MFFSCTNEMDIKDKAQVRRVADEESNITEILRNKSSASYYVNAENALVFETIEDYAYVLNMISKFSNEEFRKWESGIGFVSYRSFTDDLFENRDDTESLVNDYPKYFTFIDGLVQTKVLSQLQKSIINNDGIFYIGDTQNNVNEAGIIAADLLPGEEIVSEIQIPIDQYRPNGNASYKIIPSCRLLKIKGVSGVLLYGHLLWKLLIDPDLYMLPDGKIRKRLVGLKK